MTGEVYVFDNVYLTPTEARLQERNEILAMIREEMRSLRRQVTACRAEAKASLTDTHYAASCAVAYGYGQSLRDLGWLYKRIRCRWTPGGEHEAVD